METVIALAATSVVLVATSVVLEALAQAEGRSASRARLVVTSLLVIALFVAFAVEPATEPQTLQVQSP